MLPIHPQLPTKWQDDIAQFLAQLELVKWTIDSGTLEVDLEICLTGQDQSNELNRLSPIYLFASYNAIEEPTEAERENARGCDVDGSDEDEDALPTIDLELSLIMDRTGRKEKLNFVNLLCVKNEHLGLVNLPLNIWISCVFGMVKRLLTRSNTEEDDKAIHKYLPYGYGIISPDLSEFLGLDSTERDSKSSKSSGITPGYQLPSQENQIWVSDVNLDAVCYARFVKTDVELKGESDKVEQVKEIVSSAKQSGKRKRSIKSKESEMSGRWVKIPECESGLIIYGGLQSEREKLRIEAELCQFIRNKVLTEYIDYVLDPISAKLRQDAHAFLKMLSFISDRVKNRDRDKLLGSRRWTTQKSSSALGNTAEDEKTKAEKLDKLEGRMCYSGCKLTVEISHGPVTKFDHNSRVVYSDTIKYCILRSFADTKLTFGDSPTLSTVTSQIECPLLSDRNHPLPVVREFLSWVFFTDKEQAAGEDHFRNSLLRYSYNRSLETCDFKNLKSLSVIQSLQIIPTINATLNLGKVIFNAIHQNSSKSSKSSKSSTADVSSSNSVDSGNEKDGEKVEVLNNDLCKIVLGYAIELVDPLRAEVDRYRKNKESENDDEDDSGDDTPLETEEEEDE